MIGLEYILQLYGVTNSDLAKQLRISRQNISIWLSGERRIPKKYLPTLSRRFGIPEEYFQKKLTDADKIDLQKKKIKDEENYLNNEQEELIQFNTEFNQVVKRMKNSMIKPLSEFEFYKDWDMLEVYDVFVSLIESEKFPNIVLLKILASVLELCQDEEMKKRFKFIYRDEDEARDIFDEEFKKILECELQRVYKLKKQR